jgi:hypothetical protein
MLKIDNSLLEEVGLAGLPPAEKNSFLRHIYETLEMRVGIRLADQMSNEQLDEFEQYFEAKDDAGAFKWLETNFPNYKDIVQEEFDKLKAEVKQSAPQILAASQSAAQAQPEPVTSSQFPPQAPPAEPPQPPQPMAADPAAFQQTPPAPQSTPQQPAPPAPQPVPQPPEPPLAPIPYPPQPAPGAIPGAAPVPPPSPMPSAEPAPEGQTPYPGFPPQQPPAGPGPA